MASGVSVDVGLAVDSASTVGVGTAPLWVSMLLEATAGDEPVWVLPASCVVTEPVMDEMGPATAELTADGTWAATRRPPPERRRRGSRMGCMIA